MVGASGSALSQYSGYVIPTGATPTLASATANNTKVDNTSTGTTALGAGTTDMNTLTFSDTSARTIGVGTGNTLRLGTVGTILQGAGTGALTIGASGTAGTLIAGGTTTNTAGELIFTNNSSNTMIVNSVIANNGTGATTVVKSGSGVTRLAGANTFTGAIYVNNGVLEYSDASAAAKSLGSATVAAANIVMNGGALRYTGSTANTNIFGTTFNSVSAIDVPNSAATVTMGTTTALSGTTGIAGVVGILQKTGAGALTFAGNVDNANLSVEVVGGTLNLGKTSTSAIHSVSGGVAGAALVIDSGATAKITSTGGDQILDGSSVVVKSGGIFDLNGNSEAIDGLAGSGTASVTSTTAATLNLGGSSTNAAASNNEDNIGAYTIAAANAGVASTGLNYFSGVISGSLALTKYGAGTQYLAGANTYSGATTIQAGRLRLGIANALPSGAGKGDVTIQGSNVINGLIVPGILDAGGYDQAINGLNSTTGGFVVNTPTLSNNGTAWGVTAGPSGFQTTGFNTASTTNTLTVGNNNATASFNGVLQDGFTVIPVAGTGAGTGVNGYLALTKTGTGTQTLSGANTATGLLTVNQGEVDLNTTGSNAWSGNVTVNQTSGTGTLKLLQNNQIIDTATLTVSGGTVDMNGKTETVGQVILSSGAISDSAGTAGVLTSASVFDVRSGTASAVLAGTAGLTKSTVGTVTLSGQNTYTGTTTIGNGVLSVSDVGGSNNNLGNATTAVVLGDATNKGTLSYTGNSDSFTRGFTVNAGGGQIDSTTSGQTLSVDTNGITSVSNGNLTIGGAGNTKVTTAITTGTGSLTKTGAGSAILTSNGNTYTGATNINNGVLQLGDGNGTGQLSTSSAITISSPGNFTVNRNNTVTQGTDFSGGDLAGTGSVTQAGTGTTVLNRAAGNSYSGGTTVSLGTLQVGNTSGSALGTGTVTVGTAVSGTTFATTPNAATLSGTGFIGTVLNPVNVNIGTAPGTSPTNGVPATVGGIEPGVVGTTNGSLTITGNLTVDRGSMVTLKISNVTTNHDAGIAAALGNGSYGTYLTSTIISGYNAFKATAGESDYLNITGTLKLADPTAGTVTIANNNYAGVSSGSASNIGDYFNLLDWAGALGSTTNGGIFATGTGFINGGQSGDLILPTLTSGLAWDVSQFATSGIIIVVPEPSRAILLFLGLTALVTRRRRKVA